jgi:hypothetical protein
MPRHARLDAPDTLHQVRVRGIERTALFRDHPDRADCVARLAALAEAAVPARNLRPADRDPDRPRAHRAAGGPTDPCRPVGASASQSPRGAGPRLPRGDGGQLSGGDDLRRQPRGLDGARPWRGGVPVSCLCTYVPHYITPL